MKNTLLLSFAIIYLCFAGSFNTANATDPDATTIDVADTTRVVGGVSHTATHIAIDRIQIQMGHRTYQDYNPSESIIGTFQWLTLADDGEFYPTQGGFINPTFIITSGRMEVANDSLALARIDTIGSGPLARKAGTTELQGQIELGWYMLRDRGIISKRHSVFSLESVFQDSTDIPFLGIPDASPQDSVLTEVK